MLRDRKKNKLFGQILIGVRLRVIRFIRGISTSYKFMELFGNCFVIKKGN